MSQPRQQQSPPGSAAEMDPRPGHGEQSYRGTGRLAGKAAVITGADSGIGRAVAIAFAREGADVLISYLSEDDDAPETAKWVERAGRKAVLVTGDLTNPRTAEAWSTGPFRSSDGSTCWSPVRRSRCLRSRWRR